MRWGVPDIALSLKKIPDAKGDTGTKSCVPQVISAGQCLNPSGQTKRSLETCKFDLDTSDVVFGVWHSLKTEGRLQSLLETWGAKANIVLLASTVGVRDSELFKPGVPGSSPYLMGESGSGDDTNMSLVLLHKYYCCLC